jgi:hypothetical protein
VFLPFCATSLSTWTPSTNAEPLAVAVSELCAWPRFCIALIDESSLPAYLMSPNM